MGEQPLGDGVSSSPHIYVTTLVLQRRRTHEQTHIGTRDIDGGNCGPLEDFFYLQHGDPGREGSQKVKIHSDLKVMDR